MAPTSDQPSSPTDLRETIEKATTDDGLIHEGVNRAAYRYCDRLRTHGNFDNIYTWGFRVYRTTYYRPNSDEDFRKAIDILREYLRASFSSNHDSSLGDEQRDAAKNDLPEDLVAVDDGPNQQLWQRLRLEVVEDRERLEGASTAQVHDLINEWMDSKGVKTMDCPRYRFYIIVDEEVMQSLLNHPSPAVGFDADLPDGVKVLDAAYGKPDSYFGVEAEGDKGDEDDKEDEDEHSVSDEKDPDYEGWYWAALRDLPELYFECEDRGEGAVYTWHEGKPMFTAPGFVFGNNGCGHDLCDEIHGSMMMALMMYANHKANQEPGSTEEESEH